MIDDGDVPRTKDEAAQAMRGQVRSQADVLHDRIDRDFRYHEPTAGQPELYEEIRAEARAFAHMLIDRVPPGRELSSALTRLEECVMHANAGIARHG